MAAEKSGLKLLLEQLVKELVEGRIFADNGFDDVAVRTYDNFCGETLNGIVGQHG